jgi:hypothetical protein
MDKKEFFTLLIFILIIGIIVICQDLSKGATIMSFMVGFIVLRNHILNLIDGKPTNPRTEDDLKKYKEKYTEIPTFDEHQREEHYSATNNPLTNSSARKSRNRREYMEGGEAVEDAVKSGEVSLKAEEVSLKAEEVPLKAEEAKKIHLSEREYLMRASYATPFEDPHPILSLTQPILDSSFDSANTMQVRARTRDKRCLTGAVIKDANFYRQHYGDEFDKSEKSRWWGNEDY